MAYSDFTFTKIKKLYQIEQIEAYLFDISVIVPITPSARLVEDSEDTKTMPLYAEKSKSEIIIYPIIRELKKKNPSITVFSGYSLNIEGHKELNGNPDFLISAKQGIAEPRSPIFLLV